MAVAFPPIVLGIDFGTSNSCVAFWRLDKPHVKVVKAPDSKRRVVPSTVLFKDGFTEHEVGVDPLLSPDASRLVCHIKPILGKEAIEEVYLHEFMQLVKTKDILQLACEDANSQSKLFLPEDLVQLILQQLKENAISYLLRKPAVLGLTADQANRPVLSAALHSVVLGVPAHFTEKYKEAIKLAATNAGFDEVHFMVESTAAALAYGLLLSGEKTVLVFDMGGGTTDVTILKIQNQQYDVLRTAGVGHLGGRMIDNLLFNWVLTNKLLPQGLVPDAYNSQAYMLWKNCLLLACKQCKETLSIESEAQLRLPRTLLGQTEGEIEITITREDFNLAIAPALAMIDTLVHDNLSDVHLDEVVLVGGCSRIPAVQTALAAACQRAGMAAMDVQHLCTSVDPETVVAQGLAIQGARLSHAISDSVIQDLLVFDCMARTIGLAVWDEEDGKQQRFFEPMVTVGTKLPATVKKRFQLAHATQRQVSLDVYEEFQELAEDNSKKMLYSLVMALDAPVQRTGSPGAVVDVVFTVSAEQDLSYEVVQVLEGTEDAKLYKLIDKHFQDSTAAQSRMLVVYLVFLVLAYVFCKYALVPSLVEAGDTTSTSTSSGVGAEEEGSRMDWTKAQQFLQMTWTILLKDMDGYVQKCRAFWVHAVGQ